MPDRGARAPFLRAACAGSLVALVLDLLMLSDGRLSLWQREGLLGAFYDAQGRAFLHGHLSLPPAAASFEGFVIGGKTYLYFGPFPALIRLPILVLTHALDGRMTQLSMLLALVVLMVGGTAVQWRTRELIRPGAPLVRGERAGAFLLALALGCGGVTLFLLSWPVVYHEAELWGAALSVAAIGAVLGVVARPDPGRIALAGLLALLAVQARVSVGLGPIVALAVLSVGVVALLACRRGLWTSVACPLSALGPPGAGVRTLVALVAAVAIPLGSAVAVNEAKFGSAFGLPLAKQVDTRIDPVQRAYVAANHGAVDGLQFVPTTLLAAVRPDAIGTVRAFPFLGLPNSPPTVIGAVQFNALLPSLSAFTSMPLFCLLTLAGIVVLVRRGPIVLLGLLLATGVGFVPALVFGSTATRYLADLLPCLWVGACIGLYGLLSGDFVRRPRAVPAWLSVGAVLVVAAILINGSVGLVQQRLLAPGASMAERASFVSTEESIDKFLGRSPHGVFTGASLPTGAGGTAGDLFVLGRCAGLYVESFGGSWLPVERTARSGLHQLSVVFAPRGGPLLTLGSGPRRVTVIVRQRSGRAAFSVTVGGRVVGAGAPVRLAVGGPTRVTVSIDRLNGRWFLSLAVPGASSAVLAPVPYDRLAAVTLGAGPGVAPFAGHVAAVPEPAPICNALARRARLYG
jgi:hypothetical protein